MGSAQTPAWRVWEGPESEPEPSFFFAVPGRTAFLQAQPLLAAASRAHPQCQAARESPGSGSSGRVEAAAAPFHRPKPEENRPSRLTRPAWHLPGLTLPGLVKIRELGFWTDHRGPQPLQWDAPCQCPRPESPALHSPGQVPGPNRSAGEDRRSRRRGRKAGVALPSGALWSEGASWGAWGRTWAVFLFFVAVRVT